MKNELNIRKKPNILFIMTDEQRFDTVGYVNDEVITPNLDALAKDCVNFSRAYTTNPSCIPSRAAIFTGRYPSQCGSTGYMTAMNDNETTFMSLLQGGGYHTAVIGKQHFFDTKAKRGYDYEDIIDEHEPPEIISKLLAKDAFGLPAHKTTSDRVSSYVEYLYDEGFRRGDELYREVSDKGIYHFFGDKKYYIDEYIGNRGVGWIENEMPEDKPWFMTLSFPGPHMPFDGLGLEEDGLYENKELSIPKTNIEDIYNKPPHYLDIVKKFGEVDIKNKTSKGGLSPDEIKLMKRAYYANMTLIDNKVGEVIKALKKQGVYDNTLIIFTTDHGDYMGDFGVATKAQYCSEALMRIPFLLKPAKKDFKGYTEKSFISSVEIAATCLTTAGVVLPNNISKRSLTQFFDLDASKEIWDDIYMEARDIRAIREERYKLHYYANRDYGEFYDLAVDPEEKNNLWYEPRLKGERDRMTLKILDRIVFLGENMSVPWHKNGPSI